MMPNDTLRPIWDDVMDALECGDSRDAAFADIVGAYSESARHYHTMEHLTEMFASLAPFKPRVDWPSLCLATWYHDFVYDSRRGDNEARSADAAGQTLSALGVGERIIGRVRELILATKSHQTPDADDDAALFLDGDLSILAAGENRYHEYRRQVREEYAWVAEGDFLRGRRAVLATFLERKRIYRRLVDLEEPARINLTAEIHDIDRRLSPDDFVVDERRKTE